MHGFKKKLILLLVIGLGIVVTSLGFLYYFQRNINQKVALISAYKTQAEARSTILDRIRILDQESKDSQPYLEKLTKSLPSETEMVSLEGTLNDLARKNNMNLSFRFGLSNQGQNGEPNSYAFNLVLTGKEKDILNWIDQFQSLAYSIRLEQIEFIQVNPGATGNNTDYTVKILGRIYLRTDNVEDSKK